MFDLTKRIAAGFVIAASMALGTAQPAYALSLKDYFAMQEEDRAAYFMDHVAKIIKGLELKTDPEGKKKPPKLIQQHKELAAFVRELFIPHEVDENGEKITPRGTTEVLELFFLFAEVDQDKNPKARFHDESHMENIMAAYVNREYKEHLKARNETENGNAASADEVPAPTP